MSARWFIAEYKGDHAKSVKAHADNGIGYIILAEQGRGTEYSVTAAFKLPEGANTPKRGRFATYNEAKDYSKVFATRAGLHHISQRQQQTTDTKAVTRQITNTMPNCRGSHSIQREINRLIQDEHPKQWPKLIADTKIREQYRQQLHAANGQWCDYRANTCACETMGALA